MRIFNNIKDFIAKLQVLPEKKRKIIFFTIIIISAIILIFPGIYLTKLHFLKITQSLQSIKVPEINVHANDFNNSINSIGTTLNNISSEDENNLTPTDNKAANQRIAQ